jgi:hypothetical protein
MTARVSEVIRGWLGWCPNARAFSGLRHLDTIDYSLPVTDSDKPPSPGFFGNLNTDRYRHTQIGTVLASCLVIGILGSIFDVLINGTSGLHAFNILFLFGMTGFLLTSTTLTVIIRDNHLEIFLGPLPLRKKRIPLSDIISVRVENDARHTVRKAVWYLLPGAGLAIGEGLVIEQNGGKTVWIGTDEPELLVKAIYSAIEENHARC